MPSDDSVYRLLPLVREFGALEKKRVGLGMTPLEYQRWRDVKKTLEDRFPQGDAPEGYDRRVGLRVPTHIRVQFETRDELRDAIISNVSHHGLFISTPFGLEVGSEFIVHIDVGGVDGAIAVPCEVVSNNLGEDLSSLRLGMGVKFKSLDSAQSEAIDRLFETVLDE